MMYVCNVYVYVYVYTLFYLPRDPGAALSTREGGGGDRKSDLRVSEGCGGGDGVSPERK